MAQAMLGTCGIGYDAQLDYKLSFDASSDSEIDVERISDSEAECIAEPQCNSKANWNLESDSEGDAELQCNTETDGNSDLDKEWNSKIENNSDSKTEWNPETDLLDEDEQLYLQEHVDLEEKAVACMDELFVAQTHPYENTGTDRNSELELHADGDLFPSDEDDYFILNEEIQQPLFNKEQLLNFAEELSKLYRRSECATDGIVQTQKDRNNTLQTQCEANNVNNKV